MTEQTNTLLPRVVASDILRYSAQFSQIEDVILLTIGVPDFPAPHVVKEATKAAIDANQSGYAPPRGIAPLRQAISRFLAHKYQLNYDPDTQLIVTGGVSEGLATTLLTLLNPGDEVLVPAPFFPPYEGIPILAHGEPVFVDTSHDNFLLTPEALQHTLAQHPAIKVVLLNYPANPTGVTYTADQLAALAEVIKAHDLWVISDEIYSELVYEQPHHSIAHWLPDRTFLLNGVSKTYAMPGWRIGFIAAAPQWADALQKAHEWSTPVGSIFTQLGAVAAFDEADEEVTHMRDDYRKRRDFITNALQQLGFTITAPAGAFYVFPRIPDWLQQDDTQFAIALANEAKVAVIPGSCFGDSGRQYIRISYATSMAQLQEAVQRIAAYLDSKK